MDRLGSRQNSIVYIVTKLVCVAFSLNVFKIAWEL